MKVDRIPSLHAKVAHDLELISEMMVRATSFQAVAGSGWILMGLCGIGGASIAGTRADDTTWLGVWLATAVLAASVGLATTRRHASAHDFQLGSAPARRFWTLLVPPLAAAAVLTILFVARGQWEILPGTWLLLYGLGLASGGSLCRRAVRNAGFGFQLLGLAAFAVPSVGNELLAAGFGGIHVIAGLWMSQHEEL